MDAVETALHDFQAYDGPKPWEEHFRGDGPVNPAGPCLDPKVLRRALALVAGRIEEGFALDADRDAVHVRVAASVSYWIISCAMGIRPALAPMCGEEADQLQFVFTRIETIGKIGPGKDPELPF